MTQTSATPVRLRRVLGMPALVLFGPAYMVPLTVFTTYGVVTDGTEGHLPGAYVVTLAAMLFTGVLLVRADEVLGWVLMAASVVPLLHVAFTFRRRD